MEWWDLYPGPSRVYALNQQPPHGATSSVANLLVWEPGVEEHSRLVKKSCLDPTFSPNAKNPVVDTLANGLVFGMARRGEEYQKTWSYR